MSTSLELKTRRLVEDVFPWGEDSHPALPATPERQGQYVLAFLKEKTATSRAAAAALLALLRPIAVELQGDMAERESTRFLYRFDTSHIVKSPEGILEKMARKWEDTDGPPPVDFQGVEREFSDLGRFRLVVNFISDMDRFKARLEDAFDPRVGKERLTPGQEALRNQFILTNNRLEDALNVSPKKRTKGERCYKGVFSPMNAPTCSVEVQIVTVLQEAWDKKDHYLVYEPRRIGLDIDPGHEREMFSMSELLYIADLTFDRLKKNIEEHEDGGDS